MSKILFLGPPAAGKTRIGKPVAIEKKYIYASSSHALKERKYSISDKDYENALMLAQQGELVPDEIMYNVWSQETKRFPKKGSTIFIDGYPRTIAQAQNIPEGFGEPDLVIYFNLDINKCKNGIATRLVCPNDDTVYVPNHNPEKVKGKCDICGQDLIRRGDSNPEVNQRRYDIYQQHTYPLVNYYKERNKLINFYGDDIDTSSFEKEKKRLKDIVFLFNHGAHAAKYKHYTDIDQYTFDQLMQIYKGK